MLARQVLAGSVAVTLPGTLLLGGVTLYVLAVLGAVGSQLEKITRSLEATRELHLAVSRADSRLRTFLLGGDSRTRTEFDPFFTTRPDRTGLGLSISYRIAHDHGGHIEVHSRTSDESRETGEAGTTVRIVLPIAAAPAADDICESGSGRASEVDGCA